MKRLLIGLFAFTSISALAHPSDDELMSQIDLGSKLKIQKDINIPSHNKIIVMNGMEYRFYSQVVGNEPGCRLSATDQNDQAFGRDVVVRAGETLTAFRRETMQSGELLRFRTDRKNIFSIFCWKGMTVDNGGLGVPSIGQVKTALKGIATIELGNPVEL